MLSSRRRATRPRIWIASAALLALMTAGGAAASGAQAAEWGISTTETPYVLSGGATKSTTGSAGFIVGGTPLGIETLSPDSKFPSKGLSCPNLSRRNWR